MDRTGVIWKWHAEQTGQLATGLNIHMALLVPKYTLVLMVGNDMESVLVRGQQFQVAIEIRALTICCHGWLYTHGTLIKASHASMRVL